MSYSHNPSFIEKIAENLKLIPNLHKDSPTLDRLEPGSKLTDYPPPEKWDDWVEYEAKGWARKANPPWRL